MSIGDFINSLFLPGGIIITIFLKAYSSYRKKRKKTDPEINLLKIAQVYESMQETIQDTLMDRYLIYKISDGDKLLMLGVPVHMTVLYEVAPDVAECKSKYQNFLLDQSLTQVFKDSMTQGSAYMNNDVVAVGSLLHAMMNDKKTRHAQLYYITKAIGMMWFAEISSSTYPYQTINDDDQSKILLSINKIKGLFQDSAKYL